MKWYSVFDTITGALHSIGTVIGEHLPTHFGVLEHEEEPNPAHWDATQQAYVKPEVPIATQSEPPTEPQPEPEPVTESEPQPETPIPGPTVSASDVAAPDTSESTSDEAGQGQHALEELSDEPGDTPTN